MRSRSSTRTRNEWRPDGAYAMSGSVLEATTAGRGHQSGTEPLPRRSLAAWRIDTGHVNGIDVAGQVVVTFGDERPSKGGSHAILLDEAATPEQTLALVDAFSGRLGGPLADLVPVGGGHPGFSQVPLHYRLDGDVITVLAPGRLRFVGRLDGGSPPTAELLVTAPEHDLVWHDDRARLTYREFRWSFCPPRRFP